MQAEELGQLRFSTFRILPGSCPLRLRRKKQAATTPGYEFIPNHTKDGHCPPFPPQEHPHPSPLPHAGEGDKHQTPIGFGLSESIL